MAMYTLLLISMLCRAHAGRLSGLSHAGLAGLLLALGLAIHDAGPELGVVFWVTGTLACGALAPMLKLLLEAMGNRWAPMPAWQRQRVAPAAE
jgi:hypothetical protein